MFRPSGRARAESDLDALIGHRLKRYENRADRRLARRAFPPHRKLADPRARQALEATGEVLAALEPPAAK